MKICFSLPDDLVLRFCTRTFAEKTSMETVMSEMIASWCDDAGLPVNDTGARA